MRRNRNGSMYDATKGLRGWMRSAALVATVAMRQAGQAPFTGAVRVTLRCAFERPRCHFGTGRNANVLRADAPSSPIGKPDLDKLARALLDALKGVCWADDAQVAQLAARKRYANKGEAPHVAVLVEEARR